MGDLLPLQTSFGWDPSDSSVLFPSMSQTCPYCGNIHSNITCPRIKSIEYNSWGGIHKIEFHNPNEKKEN